MRHLLNLQKLVSRSFNTTSRHLGNKVPEYQKLFQADNNLPVHIKGGTLDVLLYRFTMTITIAGAWAYLFYNPIGDLSEPIVSFCPQDIFLNWVLPLLAFGCLSAQE